MTILQLRDIIAADPRHTIQNMSWLYISTSMKDISELGLDQKHMPRLLAFLDKRGSQDAIFSLLCEGHAAALMANPTPERVWITNIIEKMEQENRVLQDLIEAVGFYWRVRSVGTIVRSRMFPLTLSARIPLFATITLFAQDFLLVK
jgi:hypothetical protein